MQRDKRSPLKDKPLRLPGQSLDEERATVIEDKLEAPLLMAAFMSVLAGWEWARDVFQWQTKPWLVTACAVGVIGFAAYRVLRWRPRLRALRQGMEGERAVGQFLERLRENGYHVFHDIVGTAFNIDHVLVGPAGVFAIETKTWSKPAKDDARVICKDGVLQAAGHTPDRDPLVQSRAASSWLRQLLADSTGRRLEVRPVVLFPGWFVEQDAPSRSRVWVLEPKALPAFLSNEPARLKPEDVKLFSYHLSRYVRTLQNDAAV